MRKSGLSEDEVKNLLYSTYLGMLKPNTEQTKESDATKYRAHIEGIVGKAENVCQKLKDTYAVYSNDETRKLLIKAKRLFVTYASVVRKWPCLADGCWNIMDELIWEVCRREAEMFFFLGLHNNAEVEEIFKDKRNVVRLTNYLASEIVINAIGKENYCTNELPKFYCCKTGKKFHREQCPFCGGHKLIEANAEMIRAHRLEVCKCLQEVQLVDAVYNPCVTVFIDESLRPIAWSDSGQEEQSGSYSYIMCKGLILSESEITEERIIAKGVDLSNEKVAIEKITETAIWKVLVSLKYEYGYTKRVVIYSDNKAAVNHWRSIPANHRIAQDFEAVDVFFIPREKNSKADALGRKQFIAIMKKREYEKVAKVCKLIKDLKKSG